MPDTANHRRKVLCVDDAQDSLKVRKQMLELAGCEVIAAHDAHSCLVSVTKDLPDLAVLDYHLSAGVDGEQLARDIRVLAPHLPLIMLTGDPFIPESAKRTVDVVLIKGSSKPVDLIAAIERLVPGPLMWPQPSRRPK
jgi:CheY-like chemotaxis protein